ncbi:extracellular solute-binding protein [Patescibacteria group bacterium]|nr:extracellular solute-binding protein [Patescibacteria group bacterium]
MFSSFFSRAAALTVILSLVGAGCTKGPTADAVKASKPLTLNIWGVVDDMDVYAPSLDAYRKLHPNIALNYQRFRLEEYERKMLEGMAEDRGPDIFLIHNDWVDKYMSRVTPMPKTTKVGYLTVTGSIKKEQTWDARTEPTISLREYRSSYADAVLRDTIRSVNVSPTPDKTLFEERIVAMPLAIDTLALYYNKDLLNAGGIASPPETWTQFQEQVKKLTRLDQDGKLLQSAVGMGTSKNVQRSTDLLSILMIQNGAEMVGETGSITFQNIPPALSGQREEPPSYSALTFYTDFANPSKETYTWDALQPDSLDAFVQGRTAFYFGYSYDLATIRARAPKLNLGMSKLPQIEGNAIRNYANYWAWTVSKKTASPDAAWNLINFLAQPEQNQKILALMKRPAARKALLQDQLESEDVGVFASQVLTAVTWYHGKDPATMESAFRDLIDQVLQGAPIGQAMRQAVEKVSQTLY